MFDFSAGQSFFAEKNDVLSKSSPEYRFSIEVSLHSNLVFSADDYFMASFSETELKIYDIKAASAVNLVKSAVKSI